MKKIWLLASLLLTVVVGPTGAENLDSSRRFPQALGFSFSGLTGNGFTYRYLTSAGGWDINAIGSYYSPVQLGGQVEQAEAGGAVMLNLLYSEPVDWFFTQLYLFGGGSYKYDYRAYGAWMPNGQTWATASSIVSLGPGFGAEFCLFQHFSLSLEAGYRAAWDFFQADPARSLELGPVGQVKLLYRF